MHVGTLFVSLLLWFTGTMTASEQFIAMYLIVKQIHVWLVLMSITFFQFRYWFYKVRTIQPPRPVRMLPHVLDSLLLLSGVVLAWMAAINPLQHSWLGVKLLALVVYILCGTLAMKRSGSAQWLGYLLATVAVLCMLWLATHKTLWLA
jgi:uncharacterized membrane protein SirB2